MTALRCALVSIALTTMLIAPVPAPGASILTKSRQTFTGKIVEETPQSVTIATASGKVTIPVGSILTLMRDVAPAQEEKKIVAETIRPSKAQEAFENAKGAIASGNWVKGGSLLAGLLKLPTTVFQHENRLAATAALATCHLQIQDTEGAAKVFKRRALLVASESDKKRLLATAEALDEADTVTGPSKKWQFVQTYDQAIAAGTQWKAETLLERAKETGAKAESLNKWTTLNRVTKKILDDLNEAELYVPGFAAAHKEEALSTVADNIMQAAEKAVKICTEERKFNISPYWQGSAATIDHGRMYNDYVKRYLERRKAAEDALKSIQRLATEVGVADLQTKRQEKITERLTELEELRYHEMMKGMTRKLRIMPRHLGTQF